MLFRASVGAGLPDAPTVNATATPVVVLTGPGFAPNTGALAPAVVATVAVAEFELVPPAETARARK